MKIMPFFRLLIFIVCISKLMPIIRDPRNKMKTSQPSDVRLSSIPSKSSPNPKMKMSNENKNIALWLGLFSSAFINLNAVSVSACQLLLAELELPPVEASEGLVVLLTFLILDHP